LPGGIASAVKPFIHFRAATLLSAAARTPEPFLQRRAVEETYVALDSERQSGPVKAPGFQS